MNIRALNRSDAAIFRDLRIEAIQDTPVAFGESLVEVTLKTLEDFANHLDSHDRGDFVLGAFDLAETLIGVVGFFRTPYSKLLHKGTIWGMYVRPANRRNNVGTALLTAAIERVRNMPGVNRVNLAVSSSNTSARRLYEKLGFRIYGTEPGSISIDGSCYDEDLMQLALIRQ